MCCSIIFFTANIAVISFYIGLYFYVAAMVDDLKLKLETIEESLFSSNRKNSQTNNIGNVQAIYIDAARFNCEILK